jgi:hypothetical protein
MSGAVEVDALLREAARWRLAGLLFRRPRAGWHEELRALSSEVPDPQMAAAVADAASAAEGAYLAWLGPGGPVSPREVSYRPLEDPGRLLAELAAFHAAFSYTPGAEDPVDHVAVAADFTAYLVLKQAWALASGREAEAETSRASRVGFVERHIGALASGIASRIAADDRAPAWLRGAVAALCALAGVDPNRPMVDPASFPPPGLDCDEALDCGLACQQKEEHSVQTGVRFRCP